MKSIEWIRTNCRRLFLRGLSVQMMIGVHAFEKKAAQRVMLDVDVFVPLASSTPARDSIAEVVDYDFVREAVHRRVALGPVDLQETLCDDVLRAIMEHPQVLAARVRTYKPDVYPDCEAVGVEVIRIRGNGD